MKAKLAYRAALAALGVFALAGTTLAQVTKTFTGASRSNGDNWNDAARWTPTGVPSGTDSVDIDTGKFVTTASAATPIYSGDLTIRTDATLQVGWTDGNQQNYNALGTPGTTVITMEADSSLYMSRVTGDHIVPEIQMQGDILIKTGQSTNSAPDLFFDHGINGPHTVTFNGKGDSEINLTAANSFSELVVDPLDGSGFPIYCTGAGALSGDVTILATGGGAITANLVIGDIGSTVPLDVLGDTATLNLFGDASGTLLTVHQDDTVGDVFINDVRQGSGTYGDISSTLADFPVVWIAGDALLTVIGSPSTYWDIDGATAGAGGATPAGTWDPATTPNWDTASDGTGAGVLWSAGGTATFAAGSDATGSYTATVAGTPDIGGLVLEEGDVTLSGGGLQLTDDAQVTVAPGATGTIDSTVSSDIDRRFSKAGAGTLALTGTNTYTGATRLLEGTLSIASLANAGADSPIGNYPTAGPDGLVLAGTLEYTGGSTTTDRGFSLTGDSTINLTGAGTSLTLGDSEAPGAATLTATGGAGSTLSLGELRVDDGAVVTVNADTIPVTLASARGFTPYPIGNATLVLDGSAAGNVVTGNVIAESPPGSPFSGSRGLNLVKDGSGDWTIDGSINTFGSASVTVNAGTLTLNGISSYGSATAVNGGTLIAANDVPSAGNQNGALGRTSSEVLLGVANSSNDAAILIEGPYTIGRNIRLKSADNDSGTRVVTLGGNTDDTTAFTGNIVLGDNSRAGYGINLTAVAGGNVTFSGVIQDPSPMDPTSFSVTKTGDGAVYLTNANTYSADTVVSAGTLSLGEGTNNSNLADVSTVSVETGAVLDLNYVGSDAVFFLNLGGSPAATGTWGATGSGATNIDDTFFTGTGVINNTGGVFVPGLYVWDGGDVDNTANGDAVSDGGSGTWDLSILNWDRGFTAHAAWGNTTGDTAVFGGAAGEVAVDADLNIGEMQIGGSNGYFIGTIDETHTLNFGGANQITVDQVDATINAGITGSPTVDHTGRGFINEGFLTLEPTADVSMTLGDINKIRNPANARNETLNLGGDSDGNSAGSITWTNGGQQLFLNKVGTGTWTLNGGYDDGPNGDARFKVVDGTLVLNGTWTTSHELSVQSGGTLKGDADLRVRRTGGTEQVRVLDGGTLAPGASVGTINVVNDNLEIDGTLEIEIDGTTADLVTVNGNLDLSAATDVIKVVELGAPSETSYTVVTYTGSLTGTFDTLDLPAGYSVDYSTPNEIVLNAPAVGGSAFDTWAAANGLDGSPGKEAGTGDDPDAGGKTNLFEFGFNGDPLDPSNEGLLFSLIADSDVDADTDPELLFTIAVRTGTVFTAGTPATSAAVDGIVYTVEGSNTLALDNSVTVNVATTAVVPAGAPDLSGNPDYEYVTLSLAGSTGALPLGFMQASVVTFP